MLQLMKHKRIPAQKGTKGNLRTSSRSIYLLKEIGRKGENLGLPTPRSQPDHLCGCQIEYIDTPSLHPDSVDRFKHMIVHVHVKSGLYGGGHFRIEIDITSDKCKDFPFTPPQAKLLTKIWHPNVSLNNDICNNYLKADEYGGQYNPTLGLQGVIDGLLLMFDVDDERMSCAFNPDDPLNAEAAKQFIENKAAFCVQAREWTKKYALPTNIPPANLAQEKL
eukprot:TRINITY_DN11936_c0_g1_i1.p1 TRINITY_DN11936_c0_g1~~TRINITY_DN11936_c0_g1_i1.p1  ORF type:complete len:221 (-),score=35.83 TRINITY_DN11936_c0_g1_i1:23-685(-)